MKYRQLAWAMVMLALCVVILGAFVRLSDAGLGCPDWPGCFGQLTWPDEAHEIDRAHAEFPGTVAEPGKAWKEMLHRYLAGLLGLGVLGLFVWAVKRRDVMSTALPFALLVVVTGQALLGMLTVTWQLKPVIVMGHLMGGLLTLSLLLWLAMRNTPGIRPYRYAGHVRRWMVGVGLFLLLLQIMLGGWTSANYAALACVGFPQCNGQWWPVMDFSDAFVMWRGLGVNYEFGVLDSPARTAIHMAHRIGFVVLSAYVLWLAWRLTKNRELLPWCVALVAALLFQATMGYLNVTQSLPLPVATAHNAGAAVLLLILVGLLYKTRSG